MQPNQLQVVNRADTPIVVPPSPASFDDIWRMAQAVAKSGLFGMKQPEQAFALMMLAQAEGLHPMIAARDYDIIQGRPSKKAEAMLRDFQRSGGKVEWHELTDARADATFSHPQGGAFRCDWDLARAKKAGLGGKEMWTKYSRQMLRARCVSEGCKTVFPSSTSGMYTPEEVQDFEPPKSRVETYRAQVSDLPPLAAPIEPSVPEPDQPVKPAPFELITGDGESIPYDKLSDYLTGLELAFSEAADKGGFWESNSEFFNVVHTKYVQAGKPESAIARLGEVNRKITDALMEAKSGLVAGRGG